LGSTGLEIDALAWLVRSELRVYVVRIVFIP